MDTYKEFYKILDAQSMGASFVSAQFSVLQFKHYSIQFKHTGSPAGSVKVQISNDEMGISAEDTIWDDYTDSVTAIAAAGSIYLNFRQVAHGKIRVVYTYSSGSGSMTVKLIGKS